jgi:hypothetical protein
MLEEVGKALALPMLPLPALLLRQSPARVAMHSCTALCAALGLEAAPLQLRLFSTMVDAVLSYGSEMSGMQLAAASAAGKASSAVGSKAGRLHLALLRRLLWVRQGTPTQ